MIRSSGTAPSAGRRMPSSFRRGGISRTARSQARSARRRTGACVSISSIRGPTTSMSFSRRAGGRRRAHDPRTTWTRPRAFSSSTTSRRFVSRSATRCARSRIGSARRRREPKGCTPPAPSVRSSSCSTSACPTPPAWMCAASCAGCWHRPSLCSRRATPRMRKFYSSTPAPTITSPSRSACSSSRPGRVRSCVARAPRPGRRRPSRSRG